MEPSVVLYANLLENSYSKTQAFSSCADGYGIPISTIFEKPNISNVKLSILIANHFKCFKSKILR